MSRLTIDITSQQSQSLKALAALQGRRQRATRREKSIIMKRKSIPPLRSDKAAETFVRKADLSRYDLSGFKPMRFEIEPKAAALSMRLPVSLLEAVKAKAEARGVPYSRYV